MLSEAGMSGQIPDSNQRKTGLENLKHTPLPEKPYLLILMSTMST
jgi:hypothetical protein